jgi:anaerobic selenocysteine-containing dehydrogenase
LLAVPVTVLYDHGQTVLPSKLLHARLSELFVILHPEDARRFKLQAGDMAEVSLGSVEFQAVVRFDESLPQGFLAAPRSMGICLEAPTPVARLHALEPVKAR